ncbi:HNH endonuclease signature motif containing protein, partial [Arthrobacter pigmenti]
VPVGPAAAGVAGTAGAAESGSGRVPNYAGIKAEVFVVVPVLTLMGLSDEPADLEGYGPIDEDTARELAVNAPSFKRLLTHPETGALLSYGRDRYGVPKDLQKLVRLRDRRCRGVGCNRAARTCEIDHSMPYPRGATEESNLKALCKLNHLLKTAKMWADVQHRDGRVEWTSPAGRKYSNTPDGPLPEMRPVPDIAHLIDKAKNQAGPTAVPETARGNVGEGETAPQAGSRAGADSGYATKSGAEANRGVEGKQTPGVTTPNDVDDPPPF